VELDREGLVAEDSFLGELFRLGERTAAEPERVEELVDTALAQAAENRQLRRILQELNPEAKRELVRRAEELAAALLIDDTPTSREGRSVS